ncbi:MAG: DUF881 domain-containing protein [Caldicoprobacterales bacterium]|nr:DUF881 domain-containing protein [Clostridiales bacterium]
MKTLGGKIAVMLVSMILGLMLAAQFKNVQKVGGNVSLQRTQELTAQIQKLNQEIEGQRSLITELEDRIAEYESAAQDEGKLSDAMYRELERARNLAGLTELEGAGVIITVNLISYQEWGEVGIIRSVYDEDLLMLVNELNAAGAEAIAINDERIISTSEIRNAGDYIVINTNRYSVPFEIKAVGNPDTLEASLKLLGGVADNLSEELEIKIRREERIRIPKYNGPLQYEYAVPVQ